MSFKKDRFQKGKKSLVKLFCPKKEKFGKSNFNFGFKKFFKID